MSDNGRRRSLAFATALLLAACSAPDKPQVVVYTSVDQVFSEPILARFEQETGIDVQAVYDVEAQKTVGLENRLLAEQKQPRADVFWNSEFLRTLRLAEAGVFESYASSAAGDIAPEYRSPQDLWAGIGIRARVYVVNNNLVPAAERPTRLEDLNAPRWRGKTCMAKPYFGTTSTHFAALFARLGPERYSQLLDRLHSNRVTLYAGNSTVRDAVVRGDCAFGLTDTDDVNVAVAQGDPVTMVFPDQDGEGAFAVFHTVGLVKNGPHPEAGRRLIDYLASVETEQALIASGAVQYSVRKGGGGAPKLWTHTDALLRALEPSAALVRERLDK